MASTSAAAVATASTSAGPGPSAADAQRPVGPRVSWELPTDLVMVISDYFTRQHSIFYDDSDIAQQAATFMCVGHPLFRELAEHMYAFISPHFGHELDVTENSTVPQLKAVLKEWGISAVGNKAALWKLIMDEIEADPVGGPGKESLCPCTAATKRRVRKLQTTRVSKNRAKKVFSTYTYNLPVEVDAQGNKTYALKDIKRAASKMWGTFDKLKASQNRDAEAKAEREPARAERTAMVVTKLVARGVDKDAAERATSRFWHHNFLFSTYFNPRGMNAEQLEAGATSLADEVEAHVFYQTRTTYYQRLSALRASYHYRKSSKYKQELELEARAYRQAMQDYCKRHETLEAVQATLPAHMHNAAVVAWPLRNSTPPLPPPSAAVLGFGGIAIAMALGVFGAGRDDDDDDE